ncbi:MAG: FAD-dependent thymidylate synthase [Actinobacteria bacterium]|nr:FAD-dependent thymidylate synthase [Actinomycetota bacterium]
MPTAPPPAVPPASPYAAEDYTPAEQEVLSRYFTDVEGPVFALVGLPEVVKGALFARYSRTTKSLRRLFLDEFYDAPESGIRAVAEQVSPDDPTVGRARAEDLFHRVFTDYGDDSVAQLGAAHLACEQASNLLTKVLEWGRIAAYLEQSTRYLYYDRPLGGRYRYLVPSEAAAAGLDDEYRAVLDRAFRTYSDLTAPMTAYYRTLFPQQPGDSDFVYRSTIKAKVCDDLRGLLPAATLSSVGIHASGQAYEMLLIRMLAHPLEEVRWYAGLMLEELRKVIPSFLRRVDLPDRGGAWTAYLAATAAAVRSAAAAIPAAPEPRPEVTLVAWDPDAERKVAAGALYAATDLPDDQVAAYVAGLPDEEVGRILALYAGERGNRRHKPGRALERVAYRFDVLCDYGIFRDLQRHRMLTLEWQRLGTAHGYETPDAVAEIGAQAAWDEVMEAGAALTARLEGAAGPEAAQYAVPFAYRVRFFLHMNAREAFHLLELRTGRGGHPGYRRVCQEMHRLIAEQAGHTRLAAAMRYVDYGSADLERLDSERRAAARRAAAGLADPDPDGA